MSATVKIRHGHTVDDKGFIHYNEEPSTHEHAEKLAGRRLDRRKKYCIINDQVCEMLTFVRSCTGCHETEDGHSVGEYNYDEKNGIELGGGCEECGYRGKVRDSSWMPVDGKDRAASAESEEGIW